MEFKKRKRRVTFSHENKAWGLTAFFVICGSILFYLMLTRIPELKNLWSTLNGVLRPVMLGCIMAYIILPVYNGLRRLLRRKLPDSLSEKVKLRISKGVSNLVSHVVLVVVVVGLITMAGPQILESIVRVIDATPGTIDTITDWSQKMLADYPPLAKSAANLLGDLEEKLVNIVTTYIIPSITQILGGITSGVINAVNILFDILVGLVVSVYLLNVKDTFSGQGKKFVYGFFAPEEANKIITNVREVHAIFSGFISGKIIDSTIIGLITFPVLSILNMPYALMVSVIVGVTNVIPFFGPFIGAIPCTFIILTVDPIKALEFAVYALIIQQIDGNIIGPKILGETTGIPSIWVLFSILVGGGLFGFPGMILAVPVFATIYLFAGRFVDRALMRRNLSTDTDEYVELMSIDPETKEMIQGDRYAPKAKKTEEAEAAQSETEN
ncbi:MAG: AI-2E family transporter, partial [Firmicutes bacterium]|nr:AI-2E family transporter [Bacillota bacterium]